MSAEEPEPEPEPEPDVRIRSDRKPMSGLRDEIHLSAMAWITRSKLALLCLTTFTRRQNPRWLERRSLARMVVGSRKGVTAVPPADWKNPVWTTVYCMPRTPVRGDVDARLRISRGQTAIVQAAKSNPARTDDALSMLRWLLQRDLVPDISTFTTVMTACANTSPPRFKDALFTFDHMRKSGLLPDAATYSVMIRICAMSCPPKLKLASKLLEEMPQVGLIADEKAYAAMMRAYASVRPAKFKEAFELVQKLQTNPDSARYVDQHVYAEVFRAGRYARDINLNDLQFLLANMIRHGITPSQWHFYQYTMACASSQNKQEAIRMLYLQEELGITPNRYNYNALIRVCALSNPVDWDLACAIYSQMIVNEIMPNQETFEEMTNTLAQIDPRYFDKQEILNAEQLLQKYNVKMNARILANLIKCTQHLDSRAVILCDEYIANGTVELSRELKSVLYNRVGANGAKDSTGHAFLGDVFRRRKKVLKSKVEPAKVSFNYDIRKVEDTWLMVAFRKGKNKKQRPMIRKHQHLVRKSIETMAGVDTKSVPAWVEESLLKSKIQKCVDEKPTRPHDAIAYLQELQGKGYHPTIKDFNNVIRACSSGSAKPSLAMDVLNQLSGAKNLKPNQISYNAVLSAYANSNPPLLNGVFSVLDKMQKDGREPDGIMFSTVIRACMQASPPEPETAMFYFGKMVELGMRPKPQTYSYAIKAAAMSDPPAFDKAMMFVEKLGSNRIPIDHIILGNLVRCCVGKDFHTIEKVFKDHFACGSIVFSETLEEALTLAIPASPKLDNLIAWSKSIEPLAEKVKRQKKQLPPNILHVTDENIGGLQRYSTKSRFYKTIQKIRDLRKSKTQPPNYQGALAILDGLENSKHSPPPAVYVQVMATCASAGRTRQTIDVMRRARARNVPLTQEMYNCAIYACSWGEPDIKLALSLLDELLEQGLHVKAHTMSALLRCCAFSQPQQKGLAEELFRRFATNPSMMLSDRVAETLVRAVGGRSAKRLLEWAKRTRE